MNQLRWVIGCALAVVVGLSAPAAAQGDGHRSIRVPDDYATIQAAVDHAPPGATVTVGPGTYVEEVVIDHDVTLRGSGVGVTVVRAPADLTSYGVHLPDGRALTAIVRVDEGAHVTMSDLTVSGPIPCAKEVSGIHALRGATLGLARIRVTGIQADPAACAPDDAAGRAIVYGTPRHIEVGGQRGSTAYGRVSDVVVDHYQHAGISVAGPAHGPLSRVVIERSVVTGGWVLPSFQVGLWLDAGAVVDVHDNVVRDNACGGVGCGPDPIFEGQGIGVFVRAEGTGTRVVDNDLADNEVGINLLGAAGCCVLAHNRLVDNRWFGIVIQDGDGSTDGNLISGGQVGIGVVADAVDTTAVLRGDRITGTSAEPVREVGCCGYVATAIVRGRD